MGSKASKASKVASESVPRTVAKKTPAPGSVEESANALFIRSIRDVSRGIAAASDKDVGIRGESAQSVSMSQIKPLPKNRKVSSAEPHISSRSMEQWWMGVEAGGGNLPPNVDAAKAASLIKHYSVIKSTKD